MYIRVKLLIINLLQMYTFRILAFLNVLQGNENRAEFFLHFSLLHTFIALFAHFLKWNILI
jgi:hypothetical protein